MKTPTLRSLAFAGDHLIDWLGGVLIGPDGRAAEFGTGYTYRLDSATGLDQVGVIYEALGTKGTLVRFNGQLASPQYRPRGIDLVREIDRSYYHAENYAFAVALVRLPDGRDAIAHCPREYNVLELELLDGTPLTSREQASDDFFHSRLQVSANGRWLISNGWVWHPWTTVQVYDVARALDEPIHLSGRGIDFDPTQLWDWQIEGATFVGDRLVVAANDEVSAFGVFPLTADQASARVIKVEERLGTTLMAWDDEHVACLDAVPRIVDLRSGETVARWPDLNGGLGLYQPSRQLSWPTRPWVAIDHQRRRFAIARPDDTSEDRWTVDVVQSPAFTD